MPEWIVSIDRWQWWTGLLVLVFGPGVLVRGLALMHPKTGERRKDLVSEFYSVPVQRRLLWSLGQVEATFWEVVVPKANPYRGSGITSPTWRLGHARSAESRYSGSFLIPTKIERRGIREGQLAKVMFDLDDGTSVRPWVLVFNDRRRLGGYSGMVLGGANEVVGCGETITFRPRHVIGCDDNFTPRYGAPSGEIARCAACRRSNEPYL